MTTRKLIGLFVGVPEEMLRSIGLVVVLSSLLDSRRLKVLEAASALMTPVTTSANWKREQVSEALMRTFSDSDLLEELWLRVAAWLQDGDSLFELRDELVHSVGAYEVRGDGTARFISERPRTAGVTQPQFTSEELDTMVMRLSDATDEGIRLLLDTNFLIDHGKQAYKEHVKSRERLRAEQQKALEAAMRED